ncbi:hypothetical protein VNO78_27619 [Psophocarpus tetragonolobus]|uniref:Uncharacterized protein n=1 Tax=Psophocarpus tetragonolobus TaxID=3891 RepID=A0AAN9S357_PSOTE
MVSGLFGQGLKEVAAQATPVDPSARGPLCIFNAREVQLLIQARRNQPSAPAAIGVEGGHGDWNTRTTSQSIIPYQQMATTLAVKKRLHACYVPLAQWSRIDTPNVTISIEGSTTSGGGGVIHPV